MFSDFLAIYSLIVLINSSVIYGNPTILKTKIFHSNEICEFNDGKKIYLESGDRGELKGTNITILPKYYNDPQINNTNIGVLSCHKEIVTCPSCVILLNITLLMNKAPCDFDYLWVAEPPYDSDLYGKRICGGDVIEYRSSTRSVILKFFYKNNYTNAFHLSYLAKKNIITINGNATTSNENITISSPFFPVFYPRDYGVEYLINCEIPDCRIHLIFSDYQISRTSTLEVYDNTEKGLRSDVYSGAIFRPPIIISRGSSLTIRFYANGGTGFGYKATIKFVSIDKIDDVELLPSFDCGGFVELLGGAITMLEMVDKNSSAVKIYDCVWIIKPPNSYLHLKTHLSLRVDVFDKMLNPSELIVRQGLTSDRNMVEMLTTSTIFNPSTSKTFVVPLASGFYVSLRGTFGPESKLAIVYTAFSYMECLIGSEFLCSNHRCIPIQLHCDGFDHCGDGSDEPKTCSTEWPNERNWYSHTPNYYFPKTERYPDLKAATVVFMFSSLGLLLLISALIVLLYRMSSRSRNHRDIQNHLQTISDLLDNNRNENGIPDDPPRYEAPPDYDDIIKVCQKSDGNLRKKKSRRSGRRKTESYDRSNNRMSTEYSSEHIEVILPPENNIISPGPSNLEPSYIVSSRSRNILNELEFLPSALRAEITKTCPITLSKSYTQQQAIVGQTSSSTITNSSGTSSSYEYEINAKRPRLSDYGETIPPPIDGIIFLPPPVQPSQANQTVDDLLERSDEKYLCIPISAQYSTPICVRTKSPQDTNVTLQSSFDHPSCLVFNFIDTKVNPSLNLQCGTCSGLSSNCDDTALLSCEICQKCGSYGTLHSPGMFQDRGRSKCTMKKSSSFGVLLNKLNQDQNICNLNNSRQYPRAASIKKSESFILHLH